MWFTPPQENDNRCSEHYPTAFNNALAEHSINPENAVLSAFPDRVNLIDALTDVSYMTLKQCECSQTETMVNRKGAGGLKRGNHSLSVQRRQLQQLFNCSSVPLPCSTYFI